MILENKVDANIRCLALDNADKEVIDGLVESTVENFTRNLLLIGCIVHESHDWKEIESTQIKHFKNACEQQGVENYCLIVNDTYTQSVYKTELMPVFAINFFALDCCYRINYLDQKTNLSWNSKAKKPLLLTGKSEKINRIGLLALLKKENLLDDVIYSFFPSRSNLKETEKIYNQFLSFPFRKFCKKYKTSPDNVEVSDTENGSHYSGYPFDSDLYRNTLFSVISESNFESGVIWITEKTYKTIANRHPFVMAGQPYALEYLRKLGFHTFEEFCYVKDYDRILDNKQRLEAVLLNIKNLNKELRKNKTKVQQYVEENYNTLNMLFYRELAQVQYFNNKDFFHSFFKLNRIMN